MLVQTFNPDNKTIIAATRHDYTGFTELELPQREELAWPPFGYLTRLVIRSPIQSKSEQMAEHIAESIEKSASELETPVEVLGPSVAPAEKLRGQYRFHMMVGTTKQGVLQNVMMRAKTKIKPVDDVQWMIDIDPQDML